MIHLKSNTLYLLLFILALGSCVKKSGSTQRTGSSNSALTLSNSVVKRGQQLTASTTQTGADVIKWSSTAANNAIILPAHNQAAAMFATAGTYTITASYYSASDTVNAYDSSSAPVEVTDTTYFPAYGPSDDSIQLTGGISLTLISATDTGLTVALQTTNLYPCTSYITAYGGGTSTADVDFYFNWAEVVLDKNNCMGIEYPSVAIMVMPPLSVGNYSVSAEINQQSYSGSLSVTAQYYTFTWPYTSGVTISPLQVKRQ